MDADAAQIDAVIAGMYAMISGPAGPRDWSRQRDSFHAEARQMRTGLGEDGRAWIRIMGLDDYAADTTPFFAETAFYEIETGRRTDVFGNMAHVWSIYEARSHPEAPEVMKRGINSIQLYKDPDLGWRVISMIWDNERPGLTVPPL
jgi:hypothetical protein